MKFLGKLGKLLSIILLLTACHSGQGKTMSNYQDQKMKWYPDVSAPRYYDIDLVKGCNYFTLSNGKIVAEFFGDGGAGWGAFRGVASNATGYESIPRKVNLCWFSLTENQFYKAEFNLPQDEIYQLLTKGFTSIDTNTIGKHNTYSTLAFGFAPGGGVVLWLTGAETKEVAYFKGKPTDIRWSDFLGLGANQELTRERYLKMSFDELPAAVQKQVQTKQLPIGLWELYRTKYPWSITLNGGTLQEYWGVFVNGERSMTFANALNAVQAQNKPVPNRLQLYFIAQDGSRRMGTLVLDGSAIFKTYHSFFKHTPDRAGQLVVNLDPKTEQVRVSLDEQNLRSAPIPVVSWKVEAMPEGSY